MPSQARVDFSKNAKDVERLLEIHKTIGDDAQGRRFRLEVLNKSAIVLITAIWEAYCEDIAAEALEHIVTNIADASALPNELKKQIAKEVKAEPHELAMWTLADGGWKAKVQGRLAALTEDRNRRLNTPKSEQSDELFSKALGLLWHRLLGRPASEYGLASAPGAASVRVWAIMSRGRGPRGGRAVPEGVHVDLYEAAGRVKSWRVSPYVGFTSSRLRHGAVDFGLARFRQPCIRARQGRGALAGA